jgi:hypothetical protein
MDILLGESTQALGWADKVGLGSGVNKKEIDVD